MDSGSRAHVWWVVAAVAVTAFACAAAFSAYLQPAMLLEFANLVLCT